MPRQRDSVNNTNVAPIGTPTAEAGALGALQQPAGSTGSSHEAVAAKGKGGLLLRPGVIDYSLGSSPGLDSKYFGSIIGKSADP